MTRHSLYNTWNSMRHRCLNEESPAFKWYGARGIRMCDAWVNSFEQFVRDVGPRPSPEHSIDRIDTDGHYEPGNVRWATAEEQANNKRDNFVIEYAGRKQTAAQWSRERCIALHTLKARIRRLGWTPAQALGFEKRTRPPMNAAQRKGLATGQGHNRELLTYNGETKSRAEWCELFGLKRTTLSERLRKGWSVEDALTTPVR